MFCSKCGKQIDDDAEFCPFCGESQNAGQGLGNTPTDPAPVTAPARKSSKAVVVAIIASAVAVIAVIVVVMLVLKKPPKDNSNSTVINSGNTIISGGIVESTGEPTSTAQPAQDNTLAMTINGRNITLDAALYSDSESQSFAAFYGADGTNQTGMEITFEKNIEQNKTYDKNSIDLMIGCADGEFGIDDASDVSVTVGDYLNGQYMNISVSGKINNDGVEIPFNASGKLKYLNEDEAQKVFEAWNIKFEQQNKPQVSDPRSSSGVDEVTIGGKKYSANLTELDLSGKGFEDGDIADLKKMTKLRRIVLNDNSLSDISVLNNIPSLVEIDANNNNISDISCLNNLKNIECIVMNDNNIKDISVFENMNNLKIVL